MWSGAFRVASGGEPRCARRTLPARRVPHTLAGVAPPLCRSMFDYDARPATPQVGRAARYSKSFELVVAVIAGFNA